MPTYIEVFIEPIRVQQAQTAIIAVLMLGLLDVIFGMLNAAIQGDWQSCKVRQGLGHKCAGLGIIAVGDIIDATVIAGLDLGYPCPVLTALCVALCVMEITSLMEIFAKLRPELAESPIWAIFRNRKKEEEPHA